MVLTKAREVRKYVDSNLTMTFGAAAVPDAVYDLCAECHSEAFEMNVVITAIPAEPPSSVITGSDALALRKHHCDNTP